MFDFCFNGMTLKEEEQSTPKHMGTGLKPAGLFIPTRISMRFNASLDWDHNQVDSVSKT